MFSVRTFTPMPRPPRIDYIGARHHVMNRGARRAPIFTDDADRALFLTVLAELPERFGVVIHGYALMANHFHLLLEVPRGNLSRAMQHLGSEFTRRLNARHAGWDGPVFRARFRNRLVEDESYWMHLLAYLHINPVENRPDADIDRVLWTSHRSFVGLEPCPAWLSLGEHFDLFGGLDAYRDYVADARAGREMGPHGFDADELWTPTRTAGFPLPRPEPARLDDAIAAFCEATGCKMGALLTRGRGNQGNPARWVGAWWLERAVGLSQREIAELLQTSAAQVSRWIRLLPRCRRPVVRRWVARLLAVEMQLRAAGE
jgi:putative transposase